MIIRNEEVFMMENLTPMMRQYINIKLKMYGKKMMQNHFNRITSVS